MSTPLSAPRVLLTLGAGVLAVTLCGAAGAATLEAVNVSGKNLLTICRNWIVYRSCKPYDKLALPKRIAVGDKITLTYGSNPKDYIFHVVEIRPKGSGCVVLSDVSDGREDRERLEIERCEPAAADPKPR